MAASLSHILKLMALCSLAIAEAHAVPYKPTNQSQAIKPFRINLSKDAPRMISLAKDTRLPARPEYADLGSSAGIDLDVLHQLQAQWVNEFDWKTEETSLNKYQHYTTEIEGLNVHFIHQKSSDPDAIPLLLNHGWPGSFLEFLPLVVPLTTRAETSTGKPVSFNIVIPSLPGFAFSSAPPANWTIDDTARVFNTLMTQVLGYKTFALHGTDWGAGLGYSVYDNFNTSARAAHFAFLPFTYGPQELAAENITLSALEQEEWQRALDWQATGNGYFVEQTTKPNTIGLALQDSPIGQLAWIAEKFIACKYLAIAILFCLGE